MRMVDDGRAKAHAVTATVAMADARRTEGSNRVSMANQATKPTVAAHRQRIVSRRSIGPAATKTNATFSPLTAVRWESPLARNSSTTSAGSARSSPSTKPLNSACSAGDITRAPRSIMRRTRLALRNTGAPSCWSPIEVTSIRPMM